MLGQGVLPHILPEATDIGRLRLLCFLEARGIVRPTIAPDPLRRLAAVLRVDAVQATAVAERLKLSKAEATRLVALAAPARMPDDHMDVLEARRLLHRIGAERFRDLVMLAWAARRAVQARTPSGENERWMRLLDLADSWQPVSLPVQGRDVIALGVPRGPKVGAILADIERWWEEGDYRADRCQALERVKSIVAGHV